ncbi:MAG: secretin N-terminal domain-containing protein [Burkholderiales bacterium]
MRAALHAPMDVCGVRLLSSTSVRRCVVVCSVAGLLGCVAPPSFPPSEGHISAPPQAPKNIPPAVGTTSYIPPPSGVKPQTYSVVVNEVPIKELLFALARDSKLNIDVHPAIQGLVTLNAVNVPLTVLLDRAAEQVSLRYTLEGNSLAVMPDTPYFKSYQIDYANISRNTASKIGAAVQVASTSSGAVTAGGSGSQAGSGGNSSSTTVDTVSKSDFWDVIKNNIVSMLKSTRAASRSAEERAAQAEQAKLEREDRLRQAQAVSQAGQSAQALFNSAFASSGGPPLGDLNNEVVVNPMAGTITVFGTEREQKLIQQYIDKVMASVQRQVLIEVTIVEVQLSKQYQAGVDWSHLELGDGFDFTQSLLGATLGTPPNFTIGYSSSNSGRTISATIKLLESFGTTRVLSSPKLMALNNQTALLKVVDNVVYFDIEVETNTTQNVVTTTFDTNAQTVAVGVVMSVTPQINDRGTVSLTVRPTISRIDDFVNDPNPSLVVGPTGIPLATPILNPVPQIQVREMESVLQVRSGQTVVLGGLMQDNTRHDRDGLPLVSRATGIGDLFSLRDEEASKSELVIFLRTTVIDDPSLDSDELKFFKRYLPQTSGVKP